MIEIDIDYGLEEVGEWLLFKKVISILQHTFTSVKTYSNNLDPNNFNNKKEENSNRTEKGFKEGKQRINNNSTINREAVKLINLSGSEKKGCFTTWPKAGSCDEMFRHKYNTVRQTIVI